MSKTARFLLVVALCLLSLQQAFAASYDYVIDRYAMDVEVGLDGVYQITETLDFNFYVPKHGFYRDIPIGYGARQVIVSDVQVSERTSTERDQNYLVLKIGDPNKTVVGPKRYVISYLYDPGDDGYFDYDEFYFNLVGEGWEVPIKDFQFAVSFPKPIDTDYVNLTRGQWGSTTSEKAWFKLSDDRTMVTGGATGLSPSEALTLRVQLSPGYFIGMRQIHDWTGLAGIIFIILSLLSLALAWFIWHRWGKDDDLIVTARYDAPEGLTPMDVGFLADSVVDDKDITSMIFYWADKGYLTISESGKKKDFVFSKNCDPQEASDHERKLFERFFSCGTDGVVTMPELERSFGKYIEETKQSIAAYFKGERTLEEPKTLGISIGCGALAALPALGFAVSMTVNYLGGGTLFLLVEGFLAMGIAAACSWAYIRKLHLRSKGANIALACAILALMALGVVVVFVSTIVANADIGIGFAFICSIVQVISIYCIMFLCIICRRRSAYGQRMLEEVLGLREFIDKVEMDRLKMMIDHDPMVFYHILSYAIVLGLEDTWAKKFSSIAIEPPMWYTGSNLVWDAMFYSALARRWNTAFRTTVLHGGQSSSPQNPGMRFGGSSFGSSGFSGGGFGGGGGRSW